MEAPQLMLVIEGCFYVVTFGCDGARWIELHKLGTTARYRMSITAAECRCNCPARQFGSTRCRHVQALAAVGLLNLPAWQAAG